VTEGVDLSERIAVVTGCTSGIGYETMRVLAKRGAYVLGTSRSMTRAREATASVPGVTSPLELDLGDPQSVIDCAGQLRSMRQPIDILILNAGYRGGGNERELLGGVEKHFAINHLGHFLLVNRLLDRLYFGWQARVVVVASRTSYTDAPEQGILFDDLQISDDYSDALAYGHSKLANVLFAEALARRLRGTRITANSLHPGLINTDIDRNLSPVLRFGFGILTALAGKTVEQGAATTCFVATNPLLDTTSGAYFEDCNAVTVEDSHHGDTVMADRLWDLSEALLAGHLVTHGEPDASELKNWRPRRPPGGGA
jgi:NAD(P)-dependent dehydrogenase (short-subunit alcohol dehydrogenase family)